MSAPPATTMRRRALAAAAAAAVVCAGLALPATTAGAAPPPRPPANEAEPGPLMSYVVNTKANKGQTMKAERAVRAAGGTVVQSWPQIGVVVAHSTSTTFREDVQRRPHGNAVQSVGATRTAPVKEGTPGTASADERSARSQAGASLFEQRQGVVYEGAYVPEPFEPVQYGMRHVKADVAADGSDDVLVGVLDSGIEDTHPDLAANVDAENSVGCTNAGVPDTDRAAWVPTNSGHGTHVAGIIAAPRNGIGVVGVAPNVKMASVKVVNDDGLIYPEYAVCGFLWAAERGMDVTNNSYYIDPWMFWCDDDGDQGAVQEAVRRAVRYSEDHGVVSAAAAGNSDYDLANKTTDSSSPNDTVPIPNRPIDNGCLDMPTELPGVVTVSSTDEQRAKSSFSNYGDGVIDVAAPGTGIASTYTGGGYAYLSGTSMASPHAAGVLALLAGEHPDASPAELVDLLRTQADDMACPADDRCTGTVDDNGFFGEGMVDALDAAGPLD